MILGKTIIAIMMTSKTLHTAIAVQPDTDTSLMLPPAVAFSCVSQRPFEYK